MSNDSDTRVGARRISWKDLGATRCPGCGMAYSVAAAPVERRGDNYFRCERCGVVVDEWCSAEARRYTPISDSKAA